VAQTCDFSVVDELFIAVDTGLCSDLDDTVIDAAAADLGTFAELKNLQDAGVTDDFVALLGLKFTCESVGDILEQLVDDTLKTDLNAALLGKIVDSGIDPDVETDHDTAGRGGEVDVALADGTDSVIDDLGADLLARKLFE